MQVTNLRFAGFLLNNLHASVSQNFAVKFLQNLGTDTFEMF